MRMQAQFGIAGVEGDGLYAHRIAGNHGHHGKPPVVEPFGIARAKDSPGRLLDSSGGVVHERLPNGGNQCFVGENRADFVLGNVHG
jgi:hypothetical protein